MGKIGRRLAVFGVTWDHAGGMRQEGVRRLPANLRPRRSNTFVVQSTFRRPQTCHTSTGDAGGGVVSPHTSARKTNRGVRLPPRRQRGGAMYMETRVGSRLHSGYRQSLAGRHWGATGEGRGKSRDTAGDDPNPTTAKFLTPRRVCCRRLERQPHLI
jgi:hypothetical protein